MNNKTLLIIAYVFLLTLAVQFFFAPKTNTNTNLQNQGVILQVDKESVTIPNVPKIELVNHATGAVTIDTCRDISITIDSNPLTDIAKATPEFCESITTGTGDTSLLPFSKLYRVFASLPGKYIITAKTPFGDRMVLVTVSEPSTIRSVISKVFYEPIYNLFIALLTFLPGHELGWAIVVITLMIRLLLLAPQHHMLMSQKKLQLIQPKIKELQTQYKDDQAKLGMEMLELYKKEWVNPMGSCLPLLIQMPILIGLYWVISGANDPANYYHLYSFFSNFDPTKVNSHFAGLDLQHVGGTIGLIFSVILGGLQWIQAKLSFTYNPPAKKEEKKIEKKEGETPDLALDPAMMQNMMLYMFPIMIATTSYFFPLGVGLYWFIGTLFVILQQWYVNRKKSK